MKKYLFLTLAILSMAVTFTACSSDNDDEGNKESELIEASYNRVKNQIIGNWVLESYYESSTTNPYIKIGWNDAEYWSDKLSFSNNNVTDNDGKVFPYTIIMKKDYTISSYKPSQDDYQYIYKKGIVLLKYGNNKYICDIKSDGKLYLYDFNIGLDGTPKYRYKRY